MTPERWQQIDQLFHSALERDSAQRTAFLAQACAGDEPLRREVESLIASHDQSETFIEMSAGDVAAELFAEGQAQLIGQTVGPYKIVELLGRGGMGEVYLAQDIRLGRQVALKLLPAQFTRDADRLRRFEQEARAASALNHPNIVTIHEIGQVDGAHFIVTEFIEGQTLRQQTMKTPMKLGEAIEVATQVASALAAAHAGGIVHRDIKPENIMLRRDGFVKVLDFGLAKLTLAATVALEAPTKGMVNTDPGMVMGTVEYMSPEQARGEQEVDARTDIWSLGVVLYEMVTGRAPFEGETPSHLIVSILEKETFPLKRYLPEVPDELDRIVNKALRKDREERYQTVKDLALDLQTLKQELAVEARLARSIQTDADGKKAATKNSRQSATETDESMGVGTADVVTTNRASSAEYILSEIKSHKRSVVLALAALVIAIAGVAYFFYFAKGGEAIDSVAIMPFVNVSGDPNTEYLSDGISDSIINNLSQLPNLKVIALNSVLRYKGKQTDPQVVGRELNVRAVLMGRLIQQGDGLSISTELVDVRDNRRLWGEQYNRKLADIAGVQTDIAQEISERLRLRLSGEEKQRLKKRYTDNGEAYQLYLMGRSYSNTRSDKGLQKSIELFEQAIKKDPNYAPAYAGLSLTYSTLGFTGLLPAKEARQKQEWAALKAMEIDDMLTEAHVAVAIVRKLDLNWSASEEELKRALELDPNSVLAHVTYAYHLAALGRLDEAMPHVKRAQELDPLSLTTSADIGNMFYYSRQYDRAIEQFQKIIQMDPNFAPAHTRIGGPYLEKGMYEEAITEHKKAIALDDSPGRWGRTAWLGYAYAVAGRKAEAQKILDDLKELAKQRYVSPYNFAVIYMGLGDKDQAFVWLEKTYEERPDILYDIKISPRFDSLRSDPRFADLLRRMKLAS